jgi:type II restriction enzyme
MAVTGNKGEWSEVYAFLRLLADGKLIAADERLNRIDDMFFPIMKIIREETRGELYEYRPNTDKAEIEVCLNGEQILRLPVHRFDEEAKYLLGEIKKFGSGKGSFGVERTEAFIRGIHVNKLKAPSQEKSDINIQIHDINTCFEKTVGFSIKSDIGEAPTLLNAGRTTNFIYKTTGLNLRDITEINSINSNSKVKDRVKMILNKGGKLKFSAMENKVFYENLIMIDSQMPSVIARMLIGYYSDVAAGCTGLTKYVRDINPLSLRPDFYKHKVKETLCAAALGMKPGKKWDGTDEASGGYIVVKKNGEVSAYHIYNRDAFKNYLFENTRFESGSTTRHGYGLLYEQNGEIYINLNLQIRFK